MKYFGPRAVTPHHGLGWLTQALYLLFRHPGPFVAAALLAPAGSILLLTLPVWDFTLPVSGGWLPTVSTVICYGFPLALAVSLATGLARAVNRRHPLPLQQLLIPTTLKVLLKSSLFLFSLLLQGYLAIYLIHDLVSPAAIMATLEHNRAATFAVTDTILGTQLAMTGGLLLVMQLLFAGFVMPLYLFRETPFYSGWQLSFLAMQLNPWLGPALGLLGIIMILMTYFGIFSVLAQVLALPLPAYLGALYYVAWSEIFQGDAEEQPTDWTQTAS
jgi:hypothetical protein